MNGFFTRNNSKIDCFRRKMKIIKISNRSQKTSTVPSFEEFLEYILASDLQGNMTNEVANAYIISDLTAGQTLNNCR